MKKEKRPSAAELFKHRHYERSSKTVTVASTFPSVAKIQIIETIFPDAQWRLAPTIREQTYGPDSRAFFSNLCTNNDCTLGDTDLLPLIREMVDAGMQHTIGKIGCQGTDAGRYHCSWSTSYEIMIDYNKQ